MKRMIDVDSNKYQKIVNGINNYLLMYNPGLNIGEEIDIYENYNAERTGKSIDVVIKDIERSCSKPSGLSENWFIISFELFKNDSNYNEHFSYTQPLANVLEVIYDGTDAFSRHVYVDAKGNFYKNVSKYNIDANRPDNLFTLDYNKEPWKRIDKKVVVVKEFSNPKSVNKYFGERLF